MNKLSDEEVIMEFLKEFRNTYLCVASPVCHELYAEIRKRGLLNTFVKIHDTLYGNRDSIKDLLWTLEFKYCDIQMYGNPNL
jgi:hypothetical protein